jgi:hypothetical protein
MHHNYIQNVTVNFMNKKIFNQNISRSQFCLLLNFNTVLELKIKR